MKGFYRYILVVAICMISLLATACGNNKDTESASKSEESQKVENTELVAGSFEEYQSSFEAPAEYSATVVVTINPEARLYLDANNNILAVEYLNQDAKDAYENIDFVGTSYSDCLEKMVQTAIDQNYLKEGKAVNVKVEDVTSDSVSVETLTSMAEETVAQVTAENKITAEVSVSVDKAVEEKKAEEKKTEETKTETKCTACNGTGNDCQECNGTGIVNCKRCKNGVESCGTCKGTAQIKCHGCKGSGTQGDFGETCSYCSGSGIMSCDACGGQGTFLCSWCKGELRHICPMCEGNGSCSTCGGDGLL